MDTAATLALLLNRMIDGAASRPDHETTPAILDEASHFGERHLGYVRQRGPPDGGGPREDGRPRPFDAVFTG
jgi:hypothetical protein